jgi:hypothetical protein
MRVLIFGSKHFSDLKELERIIKESMLNITTIITPLNIGVCETSEQWAARNEIPHIAITYQHLWQKDQICGASVYRLADAAMLIYVKLDKYSAVIREEMLKRGKIVFEKEIMPSKEKRKNYKYCKGKYYAVR